MTITDVYNRLRSWLPAILQVLAAGAIALVSVFSDRQITRVEWAQVAVAVVTACGVYVAGKLPNLQWPKTVIAAALAALNVLITYLAQTGPITSTEWVNIVLAVLAALGVPLAVRLAVPRDLRRRRRVRSA